MNRSSFASVDRETFDHPAIEGSAPLVERQSFAMQWSAVASIARKSADPGSIALNSLKQLEFVAGHSFRSPYAVVHHFVLYSSDDPFQNG